jgi:hypothetical protein
MDKLPARKVFKFLRSFTGLLLIITVSRLLLGVARAGTFTSADLTISDSRAGWTDTEYAFDLTAIQSTAIKTLDIYFCTTPSGTCTPPTGMDTTSVVLDQDNITGTGRTTGLISGGVNTIRVTITTPATQNPLAMYADFSGITNPTTENASFYARVYSFDGSSAVIDTATVAAAILTSSSISIQAEVTPTFTFTVAVVNSGGLVNGQETNITPDANLVNFGILADGTPKIAAHDLSVTSNALGGYQITVKAEEDPPLQDGSNDIDAFGLGSNADPEVWDSPSGGTANTDTGWFGYTTNDSVLSGATPARFTDTGNEWAATTTSPAEVAYNAVAVGAGETTRVGWQVEVNETQPAGTYTGRVILVATPTY